MSENRKDWSESMKDSSDCSSDLWDCMKETSENKMEKSASNWDWKANRMATSDYSWEKLVNTSAKTASSEDWPETCFQIREKWVNTRVTWHQQEMVCKEKMVIRVKRVTRRVKSREETFQTHLKLLTD